MKSVFKLLITWNYKINYVPFWLWNLFSFQKMGELELGRRNKGRIKESVSEYHAGVLKGQGPVGWFKLIVCLGSIRSAPLDDCHWTRNIQSAEHQLSWLITYFLWSYVLTIYQYLLSTICSDDIFSRRLNNSRHCASFSFCVSLEDIR